MDDNDEWWTADYRGGLCYKYTVAIEHVALSLRRAISIQSEDNRVHLEGYRHGRQP